MKKSASIMGMPVSVEVRDQSSKDNKKIEQEIEKVFDYLRWVDKKFSPYKDTSDVTKYNRGGEPSADLKKIFELAEKTKNDSNGYFDIKKPNGKIDPSGIVKGWAIYNSSDILRKAGYKKFFIDVAGDAEIVGKDWKWGIRNPFNVKEVVKVLKLSNCGIATSGTYERGQHIYLPADATHHALLAGDLKSNKMEITDIVSLTVIGPNVYEADRFATSAFAMGRSGIKFIESLNGFEGYMIDRNGIATMTSGFSKYEWDSSHSSE